MAQTDEEKRRRYLLRTYGIDNADYDRLAAAYNFGCWICRKKPKPGKRRLSVEHDHKTGRVRGLACWSCNKLLAAARDNPETLRDAADYLEDYEAQTLITRKD